MAFERLKAKLDWLQHGYLIFQILTSSAAGTVVRALLVTYTRISQVWIWPIWLGATAIVFGLLVYMGNQLKIGTMPQQGQQLSLLVPRSIFQKTGVDLQPAHDAYKLIDPRMTKEAEDEIRKAVANLQGPEREKLLIELVSCFMIAMTFLNIWRLIYRSQIRLLQELNRHPLTRTQMLPFYTEAMTLYPQVYASYKFEQWLGFMRTQVLIAEDGDKIHITIRGQAFLKMMLDAALSENDRIY